MACGAFGCFSDPCAILKCPTNGAAGGTLFLILNSLTKLVIVIAGLYTFWNFIQAGYMYMSAGGDPKALTKAWDKIWQSLVGLLITAGAFILAGVLGLIIFQDATALITLRIFSP